MVIAALRIIYLWRLEVGNNCHLQMLFQPNLRITKYGMSTIFVKQQIFRVEKIRAKIRMVHPYNVKHIRDSIDVHHGGGGGRRSPNWR